MLAHHLFSKPRSILLTNNQRKIVETFLLIRKRYMKEKDINFPKPILELILENIFYSEFKIKQGHEHSICVYDGSMYGIGSNRYGQLGLDDKDDRQHPTELMIKEPIIAIACGNHHSLAVTALGEVYGWGNQTALGNLKKDLGPEEDYLIPTKIKFENEYIFTVEAYHYGSLFLSASGNVYVCGYNFESTLGLPGVYHITNPLQLSFDNKCIISLASGFTHSLFLTASGEVYGCGKDTDGQLCSFCLSGESVFPKPTKLNLQNRHIIAIACGHQHSLFLTAAGEVYASGCNAQGQLGLEIRENHRMPTKVEINEKIIAISCGTYHSLFLTKSHKVYVCGSNRVGQIQIGVDAKVDSLSPEVIDLRKLNLTSGEYIIKVEAHQFTSYLITNKNRIFSSCQNDHNKITFILVDKFRKPECKFDEDLLNPTGKFKK